MTFQGFLMKQRFYGPSRKLHDSTTPSHRFHTKFLPSVRSILPSRRTFPPFNRDWIRADIRRYDNTTRERSRGTSSLATRLRQLKFFGKLQKGSFGILIASLDGLFSFLRPRIDGIALFAESRILENQWSRSPLHQDKHQDFRLKLPRDLLTIHQP